MGGNYYVVLEAMFLHTAFLADFVFTCGSPATSLCLFSFVEALLPKVDSISGWLSVVQLLLLGSCVQSFDF